MNPPTGPFRYSLFVRGKEMDLAEGEVTLGRSRAATVSIIDPSMSRVHARLHLRGGRATLEDLGSSNGTYVNGIRLMAKAEIASGDRISLGETDVELRIEEVPSENATRRIDPRSFLCAHCGRPFADDARFCASCGRERPGMAAGPLTAGAPPAPAQAPASAPRPRAGKAAPAGPIDLPLGDATRLAAPPRPPAPRRGAPAGASRSDTRVPSAPAPGAGPAEDVLPPVDLEPLPPRPAKDSSPGPEAGAGRSGSRLGKLFRR